MHIVLDSNIYAADYRMTGVAFRTLFDYLRRTESRLVLPRIIREEVVSNYGRRLKSAAKEFAEVWNRYRHVDLEDDREVFHPPDIGYAMKALRRKLMTPVEGVVPVYIPETKNVSVDEIFMRGVHRTRPANQDGEELRDVIIWLWVLEYSNLAAEQIAFISRDAGFWTKGGIHSDIAQDLGGKEGRVCIYPSIDDFAKQHAPAPSAATDEWLRKHFHIQAVERQLIDHVAKALKLPGTVRDLALESYQFVNGSVFDVGPQTQFAELRFKLIFKFTYSDETRRPYQSVGFRVPSIGIGEAPGLFGGHLSNVGYLSNVNRFFGAKDLQPDDDGVVRNYYPVIGKDESLARELHTDGEAEISVRLRGEESREISVDRFELDRWALQKDLYSSKSK
jgi:hypothetical protein